MKKLFLLITLFWMVKVNAQYSPTGVKSMFSNGIALGTQSYKYYPDSNVIYWRYDSVLMGKYKGTPFQIGKAGSVGSFINNQYGSALTPQIAKFYISDSIVTDSALIVGGNASFAKKIYTDSIRAITLSRGALYDYAGTKKASWGTGGYSLYLYNNKAQYDDNFGSGFTARSLIDKGYADSAIALKAGIADTSSMLSNYRRKTTLIENSDLRNSSLTIGSTSISLGGTSTTLAGLSSVTSTGFTGALTGNASTATTLATARNIQGVSFNGSANIDIINGTGFVKSSGTTLSYDNSTYLTTSSAASTYLPLSGGTLTGSLSGTSATFGGRLQVNSGYGLFVNGGADFLTPSAARGLIELNGTSDAYYVIKNSGSNKGYFGYDGTDIKILTASDPFKIYTNSILALTINTSQAATFASSVTASAFYESSDIRLKKVLGRSYSRDGIDAIQFRWKDVKRGHGVKLGYVAQEVKKVLPYAVKEGDDKYLTVDYTMVHTYKIAQQEQRITELERELAELKDLVKKLLK